MHRVARPDTGYAFYFTKPKPEAQAGVYNRKVATNLIMVYNALMRKAKIIDIKTRKSVFTKTVVTREEFLELVDATKDIVSELRNVDKKVITDLLTEMKFCACFNEKFRNRTYEDLEDLFYDLYERVNGKS